MSNTFSQFLPDGGGDEGLTEAEQGVVDIYVNEFEVDPEVARQNVINARVSGNEVPLLGVPPPDFQGSAGRQPFTQNDPYALLQNLPPQRFRQLQDTLSAVGLLDPTDAYFPGEMTVNDPTFRAVGSLMTYANNSGQNVDQALRTLQQQVSSPDFNREDVAELMGQGTSTERGRVYSLPDSATLKARVRGQFKQALGRDPTAQEMQMFSDEMMADYQSEIANRQDDFETVEGGGDVIRQQVDPVARFQEAFQQRMGGQIKSIETQEETAVASRASERQVDVAEREALR